MMVLIACEESGAVRDAFMRRGHYAMSCDFLPTATPGPHYQGDVMDILHLGWDMMLAFPPCTYLCSSGLHWNGNPTSPRYGGADTEAALLFVQALLRAPIKKKVLENPRGCIGTRIRPASQWIQPYEFGDDASKCTGLWLEGVEPLPIDPSVRCPGRMVLQPNGKMVERWSNQTDSGQNKLGPSDDRALLRSKTYPGIADAMALHWG